MSDKVDFHPTKNLFIDVLTRDISIRDCIFDLLDNSVDSYTRHQLNDLRFIYLSFNRDSFETRDNCGGISKEELTKNVFRFGATDFSSQANTIGLYGIGLKRAIFKIGSSISFKSDDGASYCLLNIDVDDWKKQNDWDIELTETGESRLENENPYTEIKIAKLREETKESFTPIFESELRKSIGIYYSQFINKNKISFSVNGHSVPGYEVKLKVNNVFKPVKYAETYDNDVNIEIICWVDIKTEKARMPKESGTRGWNVYMNDRLVLLDDTTADTGWIGERPYLPNFHQIYNYFRGIVTLKTTNPSKLPINTSKNNFNKENKIYEYLLLKMCEVARPIIDYLSTQYDTNKQEIDIAEDKATEEILEDEQQLTDLKTVTLAEATYTNKFDAPKAKSDRGGSTSIQYTKSKDRVDKVKMRLEVKSNTDVGSETFEYFWDGEGLNDTK